MFSAFRFPFHSSSFPRRYGRHELLGQTQGPDLHPLLVQRVLANESLVEVVANDELLIRLDNTWRRPTSNAPLSHKHNQYIYTDNNSRRYGRLSISARHKAPARNRSWYNTFLVI